MASNDYLTFPVWDYAIQHKSSLDKELTSFYLFLHYHHNWLLIKAETMLSFAMS